MPFSSKLFGPVGQTTVGRIAAHGVIGGTSDALRGGKFGPGAFAGAFAKFATPISAQFGGFGGALASATVGGTASVIGGGKFANGAVTGGFGYLLNFRSSTMLRATVPGQVAFDNGMTGLEEGRFGSAILGFTTMLAEQVLTVATFGAYQPAATIGRISLNAVTTNLSPSRGMLRAFQQQLDSHGVDSLLRSRNSIQRQLTSHLEKLPTLEYKSSVQREIRTFRRQLNAIDELLK